MGFQRRHLLAILLVVMVAVVAIVYLGFANRNPSTCQKPQSGYLVVASNKGFNDSVTLLNFTGSGPPRQPWPSITVSQGAQVVILVCNKDTVAHGFQVGHYYTNNLAVVPPGGSMRINFTADVKGVFQIYCEVPCPIHVFMQYGRLTVK